MEGVDYLSASSSQGRSQITLRMALDQDSRAALGDVLAKVNQVKHRLPEQAYDPVIERSAGDATAVAYVGFSSETLSAAALTDYLSRVVQPLFAGIDGVAKVETFGGQRLALRVWLDAQRMAGHGITPAMVEAALRDDTTLVSIMHVNNEIGTINDIAAIGELTRSRGVLFHVDAAQSTGKVAIDLEKLKVDLMSFSAHKTYGPKGVGALYVRRKPRVRLEAQTHGGGHERGMRSGTLATHQCVGMGEAFRIAKEEMAQENQRVLALRDRFFAQVDGLEELYVNGSLTARVPHNLNMSFNYVEGESLIMGIKGLAVSSGSACTSASLEPSYVLRALGRNDELAHSSIRFTFGRFTTEEEVDYAAQKVREAVTKLRELSPLWDMYKDGVDLSKIEWAAH